jgi:ACS family tartrate transporter-like MFS transporter
VEAGKARLHKYDLTNGPRFVGPYWMGIAKDLTGNYRRGLLTMAVPMLIGAGIIFFCADSRNDSSRC